MNQKKIDNMIENAKRHIELPEANSFGSKVLKRILNKDGSEEIDEEGDILAPLKPVINSSKDK